MLVPRSACEQSPMGHELLGSRLGWQECVAEAGLDAVRQDWHIGLSR